MHCRADFGGSQTIWIAQLPGVELATDSCRHSVLNWQQKRVGTWRCDSPLTLFEVTPVNLRQLDDVLLSEICHVLGASEARASGRQR